MISTIVRFVAVVAIALLAFDCGRSCSAVSIAAVVGAFATYVGAEYFKPRHERPDAIADRALLADLKAALPFDPTIRFLQEHDFGASYAAGSTRSLDLFVHGWVDPSRRFHDKKVQKALSHLLIDARAFQLLQGRDTFVTTAGETPDLNRYGVPTEWRERSVQKHRETVQGLNGAAESVVSKYTALLDVARRRLLV